MTEWWTYRLADFLMFSPRTYWRLVEQYNRDVWPAQPLAAGTALLLLLWLSAAPRADASRVVAAALAATWLWVGWAFHWQRYATINWAAPYFAVAFGLEAALLVVLGVLTRGRHRPAGVAGRNLGWALTVSGLLLYPLAGLAAGRPWSQAEFFGVMPEPTAMATLGLVLAGAQPYRKSLFIVPVLSLMSGFATLWMLSG